MVSYCLIVRPMWAEECRTHFLENMYVNIIFVNKFDYGSISYRFVEIYEMRQQILGFWLAIIHIFTFCKRKHLLYVKSSSSVSLNLKFMSLPLISNVACRFKI